jgi:hypothetical protein
MVVEEDRLDMRRRGRLRGRCAACDRRQSSTGSHSRCGRHRPAAARPAAGVEGRERRQRWRSCRSIGRLRQPALRRHVGTDAAWCACGSPLEAPRSIWP